VDFGHRLRAVGLREHVKTAPIVDEIDVSVLDRKPPEYRLAGRTRTRRRSSVLARQLDRRGADVDGDHVKALLDQEYGVMARSGSDVQRLPGGHASVFDEPDQVGIGAAGIPWQRVRPGGQIDVLPIAFGDWHSEALLSKKTLDRGRNDVKAC